MRLMSEQSSLYVSNAFLIHYLGTTQQIMLTKKTKVFHTHSIEESTNYANKIMTIKSIRIIKLSNQGIKWMLINIFLNSSTDSGVEVINEGNFLKLNISTNYQQINPKDKTIGII